MGGRTSQLKGKRFELSIANKLKELFKVKVRRTPLSGGMDFKGDIICIDDNSIISEYSFECKNQEKINIWESYKQADENSNSYEPVVVLKRNKHKPLVLVDAEYFVELHNRVAKELTIDELLTEDKVK